MSLQFYVFMGLLSVGTCASLSVSCTFSWDLFLLFVLYYSDGFIFSFSYWTVFYYSPIEASLFSNEKEKGGESGQ